MPESFESLPDIPYGDTFNAACLVQRYGDDLRYCGPMGGWFHWTGTHWKLDTTQYLMDLARQTISEIGEEALKRRNKDLLAHIAKCFQHQRLKNMLAQAESFRPVVAEPAQFDQDPWLLNCLNGTVDLRYGLIDATRPHKREDWITRCLHIPYQAEATCPVWLRFLWRIMGGPAEDEEGHEDALLQRHERATRLVSFLRRAVGYALTGRTDEQCLFILYGTGRNGKSRFLEACHEVLGPYAKTANMRSFIHQEQEAVRNDLADLQGVRLVSAIETSQGQKFSEGLLKQLTGGDHIKARFLFREYFEFLPHFKLFLAFNHKPTIKGNDLAIWERIRMIPFDVYIPPGERDHQLADKLREELPGILAWAVEGCLEWQVGGEGHPSGLRPPDEVDEATSEYREEMDHLGAFLQDRCLISQHGVRTDATTLYVAYKAWCEGNAQEPISTTALGIDLQQRGIKRIRTHSKTWYLSLGLKEE
jgi:putative DNA primase/helicase